MRVFQESVDQSATSALAAAADEHRPSDGHAVLHAQGDPAQLHDRLVRRRRGERPDSLLHFLAPFLTCKYALTRKRR